MLSCSLESFNNRWFKAGCLYLSLACETVLIEVLLWSILDSPFTSTPACSTAKPWAQCTNSNCCHPWEASSEYLILLPAVQQNHGLSAQTVTVIVTLRSQQWIPDTPFQQPLAWIIVGDIHRVHLKLYCERWSFQDSQQLLWMKTQS